MLRLIVSGLIALLYCDADASYLRADRHETLYFNLAGKVKGPAFTSYPLDAKGNTSTCSGTLISQGAILTAGHCVPNGLNITLEDFKTIKIGIGRDRNDPNVIYRGAKHVRVHPSYIPETKSGVSVNYDIAIILLDTPIYDSPVEYGELSTMAPQVGDKIMVYGFGTLGVIGKGEAQPNDKLVAYQSYIDSFSSPNFKGRATKYALQELAGVLAPGDSGGGVVNTSGKLIGVNSGADKEEISLNTASAQVNLFDPQIMNFLKFLPIYKNVTWVGDGNVSDPSNWSLPGEQIENLSQRAPGLKYEGRETHYDVAPIMEGKTMVVDTYLHVDRVVLEHKYSKFVVNEGAKARFDHGLDLRQGSVDIKGEMEAGFLRVGPGMSYASGEFNLYDGGYVVLDGGSIDTSKFNMEGGVLEGKGRLRGNVTGGSIFPKGGNIYVTGGYDRRSDESDVIGVGFFPAGKSEYLSVGSLNSSKLHFKFFFPNVGIVPGTEYVIMESGNGFTSLVGKTPFMIVDVKYDLGEVPITTRATSLSITPTKFELKKQTVSDTRPQVHAGLASMAPFLSKSFKDYANAMPSDLFLRSLDMFLDSHVQIQLYKSLMNHVMRDEHTYERTILFLEKERASIDLASFAFYGKNSFKGDDVPVPAKDTAPLSFFISGDLYESGAKYLTKGLTMGWDYAHKNTLNGVSFHFKNEEGQKGNELNSPKEYHLEFYNASRGGFLFWDHHMDFGTYAGDVRFSNIWGTWNNKPQMSQGRIQSRFGVYSANKMHFGAAYVGLMGARANLDGYVSTSSLGLDVATDKSSFNMLSGLVGGEGKIKIPMNDILVEPVVRLGAMVSFYDNWKMPKSRFDAADQGFDLKDAPLSKASLLLHAAVRVYAPKGIVLKAGGQVSGLSDDLNTKLFLGVTMAF